MAMLMKMAVLLNFEDISLCGGTIMTPNGQTMIFVEYYCNALVTHGAFPATHQTTHKIETSDY